MESPPKEARKGQCQWDAEPYICLYGDTEMQSSKGEEGADMLKLGPAGD